jgi:hypothetical protein
MTSTCINKISTDVSETKKAIKRISIQISTRVVYHLAIPGEICIGACLIY